MKIEETGQPDPTIAILVAQGFSPTILTRFWAKVKKSTEPNGCWLWVGATTIAGYGKINTAGHAGRTELAHRVSWTIYHGAIPPLLCVLHKCPNGINYCCVNPAHLFIDFGHRDRSRHKTRSDLRPEIERFADNIQLNEATGCWDWTGPISRTGYSKFWTNISDEGHVFAYKYFFGPMPKGTETHHRCRNRKCVNPYHLEAVTHQVNCATDFKRDVCPNGHPLTPDNSYEQVANGRTHRTCKTCAKARAKARWLATKST